MIGRTLSHFKITAKLGEGGMGEVYRATDTKLDRDVALKVLPEAFTSDPERLARFEREAKVLASLNHPSIGHIYGLEESNGQSVLVLELIEGPTLAERIARGPIQLDEALSIAKQIAEALEAAHERGIIHRDLKPANVKVKTNGTVKVLDFGLAKAFQPEGGDVDLSESPTMTAPATQMGVILGTAAYMSPEQAGGKAVDKRADIWAFGCVLYEMLTGQRTFAGATGTEVLAAVLERNPDWEALPPATQPLVRRLLRRCLEKEPKRRLRDIGDARLELDEIQAGAAEADAILVASDIPAWRWILPWALAAALGISTLAVWLWVPGRDTAVVSQAAHLQLVLPEGLHLAVETEHPVLALSPDGSQLAFVAEEQGTRHLFLRGLADASSRALEGTAGAASPFFSPDGAWIGFFVGTTLKKVRVLGGIPVAAHAVAGTFVNRGATWGVDETVLIAGSANSGLARGSVAGERLRPFAEWTFLTEPTAPFAWPDFLPDGRRALFTDFGSGRSEDARVALLTLATGSTEPLLNGGTMPRYSPTGHILFARRGSVYAVPFAVSLGELTGPEDKLLESVLNAPNGAAQFAVAANGTLAYLTGAFVPTAHQLVWVDREGNTETLRDDGRSFYDPRLSPDGTQLAVGSPDGANHDIWLLDLVRGTKNRLTTHPGEDLQPIWSPDGERLALASEIGEDPENPGPELAWITELGQPPETLVRTPGWGQWEFPTSWSPDGQWLAYNAERSAVQEDIMLLSTDGSREPVAFLQTPANETAAMFSPDGRWIAYVSDRAGRDQIYVRPFPGPGAEIPISAEGGIEPMWSRDGRELFYRQGDKMMVVDVEIGRSLEPNPPRLLFEGRFEKTEWGSRAANYDVTPDGQRFVMVRRKNPATPTVIHVVLNWPQVFGIPVEE